MIERSQVSGSSLAYWTAQYGPGQDANGAIQIGFIIITDAQYANLYNHAV